MGVGLELFNWGFFAITVRIIDMSRKKKKRLCVVGVFFSQQLLLCFYTCA